jgi:hypothetical protein
MAKNRFNAVGSLRPRRTAFDLSYSKTGTCQFAELIPIMCDEVVPHDTFKIGCELIIRFQPMTTPILHDVSATVHYFFVPYRLLTGWTRDNSGSKIPIFDWEGFITGGIDGNVNLPIPRWTPTNTEITQFGTLWDLFGFPIFQTAPPSIGGSVPLDVTPVIFPKWAYNLIAFEYYYDETLDNSEFISNWYGLRFPNWSNSITAHRRWKKDYFTSALPWQQRGPVPALPLRGTAPVYLDAGGNPVGGGYGIAGSVTSGSAVINLSLPGGAITPGTTGLIKTNMADTPTFNIADLRLAVQLQKWLERNARAGVRYTEFLRSHFGVSPSDSRLNRPEYIGGVKVPILVSEVLQTSQSQTNAPQGNMAGHGIVASRSYVGSYHVTEYGLIMGLLSVMPKAAYQQGINRQWLRYRKEDFYFPEFAHLSEQAIFRSELYWQAAATTEAPYSGYTVDSQIFGFAGRYDEMRVKHDMVVSEMRDIPGKPNLAVWNMARRFSTLPLLNSQFIDAWESRGAFMRAFAVNDRNPIMFTVGNRITAIRPMPYVAEPGLIDHF